MPSFRDHDVEYEQQRAILNPMRALVGRRQLDPGPSPSPRYYSDCPFETSPPDFLQSMPGGTKVFPLYDWGMDVDPRIWVDNHSDSVSAVAAFTDQARTSRIPSFSQKMTPPGIISCRRVSAVDMRYQIVNLPPGTYTLAYYFHFTQPSRILDDPNPLFFRHSADHFAPNGDKPSRPGYPTNLWIMSGVYGHGGGKRTLKSWSKQWDTMHDADLHRNLFPKEGGAVACSQLDSPAIEAAHTAGGWVSLGHGAPDTKGVGAMVMLVSGAAPAHELVLKKDLNNVLVTISGFDGKWVGRWRFGGIKLRRVQV
ncbi:uncharacterized protein MKK02DRAFT_41006 [Dioszegia hungarica]|uniref:Uncharacterized protein n=1 Tax=Dioszegia hungarica TaxID=4972 RepID=A0AA38H4R8_9TREE|nr:uncharacterized protein MKK02DRAFT_41006 [Dioszegia hungarica]KAI9632696.1 hypothetical protein MKK02DRAFT_41006 [Dioszegia hungarica]